MKQLQELQYLTKYARFSYQKGRREKWGETVNRVVRFLGELSKWKLDTQVYNDLKKAILQQDVMPSMRLMATAGAAARRNNIAVYNCAYLPIEGISDIAEILMILISGTGVGYSVEQQYIEQLPVVSTWKELPTPNTWTIEDSAEGWYHAFSAALHSWWLGYDLKFDYSQIRPAGAVLKTKGGRASGPAPLKLLLDKARDTLHNAQGRKLTSLEVHDIATTIGECIISGGHRRSAMIALFSPGDTAMRTCKNGETVPLNRWNANNSVTWETHMDFEQVQDLMTEMHQGGRGEPGIFSRLAANDTQRERSNTWVEYGTNPCGEIFLKPRQFCNLSSVTARNYDTLETLAVKVRLATIIGTIQSMADDFAELSSQWEENAYQERLLGVDLNGIFDSPVLLNATPAELEYLRDTAHATNRLFASQLGINPSPSITCVKPSGNTSTLLDTASGIHPRYAPYYIRRVRLNESDPVLKMAEDQGYPTQLDPYNSGATWIMEFPVMSPNGAVTREQVSAMAHLNIWLKFKRHWADHNPSCTIYYAPNELDDVIQWVHKHQGEMGGLSFLPRDDHKYDLAPYEEIDRDTFHQMANELPLIDFSQITRFEFEDMTTAAQELACVAGQCDV